MTIIRRAVRFTITKEFTVTNQQKNPTNGCLTLTKLEIVFYFPSWLFQARLSSALHAVAKDSSDQMLSLSWTRSYFQSISLTFITKERVQICAR